MRPHLVADVIFIRIPIGKEQQQVFQGESFFYLFSLDSNDDPTRIARYRVFGGTRVFERLAGLSDSKVK